MGSKITVIRKGERTMSKEIKIILSVLTAILTAILVLPFAIWGVSVLRCEILTNSCGDEFAEGYKQCNMIGDIEYLKVLDYSDSSARVYYVSEDYFPETFLHLLTKTAYGKWKNGKLYGQNMEAQTDFFGLI